MANVIMTEETLAFAFEESSQRYVSELPKTLSVAEGSVYKVIWDGSEYICIARLLEGAIALGNAIPFGGEDTGEPFLAAIIQEASATVFCAINSAESAHTIAIYEEDSSPQGDKSIVLYDRTGKAVTYENVETITTDTPTEGETATFTRGVVIDDTQIDLNLANGNQTVSVPDGYLVKEATIKKPETLLPQNIKKNVEVAGVVGEFAGEETEKTVELNMADGDQIIEADEDTVMTRAIVKKPITLSPENIVDGVDIGGVVGEAKIPKDMNKPIRFYDPYGEVIYAYTKTELQQLEELPEGPELEGLTFDGWTHTLAELQSVNYFADVAPMYKKGDNPVIVLIIELESDNLNVFINFKHAGKLYIDWGDGSTSSITSTYVYYASHTYSTPGQKNISYYLDSLYAERMVGYYDYSSVNRAGYPAAISGSSRKSAFAINISGIGGTDLKDTTKFYYLTCILKSVLCNTYYKGSSGFACATFCTDLRFASILSFDYYAYFALANCFSLKAIAGKNTKAYGAKKQIANCHNLKRCVIQASASDSDFGFCNSLEEVFFEEGTSFESSKMNSQWKMLMGMTTPPTITTESPIWGTKPIFVPDSAVEAYKTADKWIEASDYIFPMSDYDTYKEVT